MIDFRDLESAGTPGRGGAYRNDSAVLLTLAYDSLVFHPFTIFCPTGMSFLTFPASIFFQVELQTYISYYQLLARSPVSVGLANNIIL